MNKKAFITNFIFGFIVLFILILVLVTLIPVQEGSTTVNKTMDIIDKIQSNTSHNFAINESQGVIIKVIYKFVDFIVYTSMEIVKAAVTWGSENLNLSAKLLIWIVMLSILAPLVVAFTKLTIISVIFIKEFIQSRREKKELLELRKKKNE